MLPAARRGGRPRTTNIRAVLNAIFYLLRTGCQWRLLPREFPVWSTVYHYFRAWKNGGFWTFRNVKGSFRFLSFLPDKIATRAMKPMAIEVTAKLKPLGRSLQSVTL